MTATIVVHARTAAEKDAWHAEIARRYAWAAEEGAKRRGNYLERRIALLRLRQLEALYGDRFGLELPADDSGADDLWVALHHVAMLSGDARANIVAWALLWAPWCQDPGQLADKVLARPRRWTADGLGRRVRLTEDERSRLKITTFAAHDDSKSKRVKRRREADKARKAAQRRAAGATPREQSADRTEPWRALGMSRRTWFRRGKPMPGDDVARIRPQQISEVIAADETVPRAQSQAPAQTGDRSASAATGAARGLKPRAPTPITASNAEALAATCCPARDGDTGDKTHVPENVPAPPPCPHRQPLEPAVTVPPIGILGPLRPISTEDPLHADILRRFRAYQADPLCRAADAFVHAQQQRVASGTSQAAPPSRASVT